MVEQTKVQRVEGVLKQIRELKEVEEEVAKATGKNFNVFSVPGFGYNELDHSAFLANLLNPKGTHSQGAIFLRHFLTHLDSFECENLEDFKVTREEDVGAYGQIDILLEKEDACIIIENKIKIDPEDRDRQLERYYKYAKKEKGLQNEQIKLIYLTPDGRKPRKISLSSEDCQRYLNIKLLILMSYKSHILKWMEDCLKEVTRIAPIREVLFQYQVLVKGLSGQPINKELTMKISDILIENYDLIPELESAISEAKKSIHDKFWEKLADKICGIERLDDVKVKDGMVPKDVKITAKVLGFELDPPLTMELIVGETGGRIWYGFGVCKRGRKVSECNQGRIQRYLDLAGGMRYTDADLDMKYEYLKDSKLRRLFSDFGMEQMLVDDEKLKKIVEKIATKEIKGAIDKFVEAKDDAGL